MNTSTPINHFKALMGDFGRPEFWLEVAAIVVCVAISGLLVRWLKPTPKDGTELNSVSFGRRGWDGFLFPLAATLLVYLCRVVWFAGEGNALMRLAVPVLGALAVIRLIARVVAVTYPDSTWARLGERFFSWLMWGGVILWLAGLLPQIVVELEAIQFSFGKSKLTLLALIQSVLAALAVLVGALWLSAAIEQRLLKGAVADLSLRKVAGNIIRALLLFIGLLMALSVIGIDLTALSVLGGALGVGLGFGLQKLASNYVSGFVILIERSLRIGDTVKVDSFEGKITDIKTRYTVIRALSGREAIVPNEKLITERVENLSLTDPKVLIIQPITVGYESDVAQVQEILVRAAVASPRVLPDPEPVAHLANFGNDGLEFNLCFWISDPENGQLNVRSQINVAILQGLRAAGVDIPYPQRVIHVKSS
jgi:small-conductance mechanosensitive channel